MSVCWQIPEVTRDPAAELRESPRPPTMNFGIDDRSALQREMRSGRGFPTMSFNPDVMKSVPARPAAKPSQPAWMSHAMLRKLDFSG